MKKWHHRQKEEEKSVEAEHTHMREVTGGETLDSTLNTAQPAVHSERKKNRAQEGDFVSQGGLLYQQKENY